MTVTCLTASQLGFTQAPAPEIWLPARHADALRADLDAIIEHAQTRASCDRVVEARLHEGTPSGNPKFIVTCRSAEFATLNLVYWQSDVRDDFANVSYPEFMPPTDDSDTKQFFSTSERSILLARCRSRLRDSLDGALPDFEEDAIVMRERSASELSIFMEFQRREVETWYLATCLCRRGSDVKLAVFPR